MVKASNGIREKFQRAINRLIFLKRFMNSLGIELTLNDLEGFNISQSVKSKKFMMVFDQNKEVIKVELK